MLLYQSQLAWRSICKAPILCAIMIFTLAAGVAAAMVCYTSFYVLNQNPLAHKDDRLFLLQTDSWDAKHGYEGTPLNQMPDLLSYRDAIALLQTTIPAHKTAITKWGGSLSIADSNTPAIYTRAQISTRDFFAMFDVEFLYGGVWKTSADDHFQNVVVINESLNQQLFNGANSVGKTIVFESVVYSIVGVTKSKHSAHQMQDITLGYTIQPEPQLYIPFAVLADHNVGAWANYQCPEDSHDYGTDWYKQRLKNACVWISFWVELTSSAQKNDFKAYVSHYINTQKQLGFYPRPVRFEISNITQKLHINRQDGSSVRVTSYIGAITLLVCTLNAVALLLAKFLRHLPESGIRRALGASRSAIFFQHLLECLFVGILGGLLGLLFTYIGLAVMQHLTAAIPAPKNGLVMPDETAVWHHDGLILTLTILTGIIASTIAGIYPAWQACRVPAANYLKIQ